MIHSDPLGDLTLEVVANLPQLPLGRPSLLDLRFQSVIGFLEQSGAGQGDDLGQQGPQESRGGDRHDAGDQLDHAVKAVVGLPEHGDAREMRSAAQHDEGREQIRHPAILEVRPTPQKGQDGERDGEVGEPDGEVGDDMQGDKVGPPEQAKAMRQKGCRLQKVVQHKLRPCELWKPFPNQVAAE